MIGGQDEALEPGLEPKVAYDIYLLGKIPFGENELRSSENFRSGCEILRLGVLAENQQLAACACVLLYEKQSLLYELLSSFENFKSGREILRLGVLIEKWDVR